MALLHVPFDESGHSRESSHVVFAGFLAEPAAWGRFTTEWSDLLRTANLSYFRSAEAFSFGGAWHQFAGHDREKEARRDKLVMDLTDCGCRHAVQASASVIAVGSWEALPKKAKTQYKQNPYYVAFERNITSMLLSRFVAAADDFTLICDDSEAYSEESLKSFRRFVRTNPKLSNRVHGICFLDDKKYPPLQLADMLAFCMRRKACNAGEGLWRRVYDKFFSTFTDLEVADVRV